MKKQFLNFCGAIGVLIWAVAVTGHILQFELLTTWAEGLPIIRVTTLIAFLLVMAVLVVRLCRQGTYRDVAIIMISSTLLSLNAITALTNLVYRRGWGLETLFSGQYNVDPSQLTLIGLTIIGIIMIAHVLQVRRSFLVGAWVCSFICGSVALLGVLIGDATLYFQNSISYGMALPTSFLFILFSLFGMNE